MITSEIRKELANRNIHSVNINAISKEDTTPVKNNTVKQPTKVLEISKAFIKDFCQKASKEDCEWITTTTAQYMDKYQGGRYFPPFRTEFAKKFMPELISQKQKTKKLSFLEELYAIEQSKTA